VKFQLGLHHLTSVAPPLLLLYHQPVAPRVLLRPHPLLQSTQIWHQGKVELILIFPTQCNLMVECQCPCICPCSMGTLLAPLQPTTTLIRHNIHRSNNRSNKEHLAILDIIHTITLPTRMLHLDPIDGVKYSVDIFLLPNLIQPVDFQLYCSAFFRS
jgi:hypothetical protein